MSTDRLAVTKKPLRLRADGVGGMAREPMERLGTLLRSREFCDASQDLQALDEVGRMVEGAARKRGRRSGVSPVAQRDDGHHANLAQGMGEGMDEPLLQRVRRRPFGRGSAASRTRGFRLLDLGEAARAVELHQRHSTRRP